MDSKKWNLSCWCHQTTKPQILFSPIFFYAFFSAWAVEKENKLLLVQNRFFLNCGLMKSSFSFSSGQTENNLWKKLGKTRFVVWWFDVTNKIFFWIYQIPNLKIQNYFFSFFHPHSEPTFVPKMFCIWWQDCFICLVNVMTEIKSLLNSKDWKISTQPMAHHN